jgi:hypothetical protein
MPVTTSAAAFTVVRQAAPDLLVRARVNVVGVEVEVDGSIPLISAATVSLLKPDGTSVITAAAATISLGTATYSIPAATLPATMAPIGEGWQLVWGIEIGGVAQPIIDREAALILRPLHPVIDDTDLEDSYPDISRDRGSVPSLHRWRVEAWKRIIGRLIQTGHISYQIKSGWVFREPHIEATLWLFYRWLAKNQPASGDWLELSNQHRDNYHAAWDQMNFTVDRDNDGRPDNPNQRQAARRALHINGAPGRIYPGGI